jgi:hypothetical protein
MEEPTPQADSTKKAKTKRAPAPAEHDPWVYRLAVGGLSTALVAFLICGGVIGASGHAEDMVKEYWTIGAALSGALVGIIAPSPRQKKQSAHDLAASDGEITKTEGAQILFAPLYQPLLLVVALGLSLLLASTMDAADAAVLRTIAAASAGALTGLLVPSPGANLKS